VYESSPQSRQSSVITTKSTQEPGAGAEQPGQLGNLEEQKGRARRYSGTVTHVAPEVFLTGALAVQHKDLLQMAQCSINMHSLTRPSCSSKVNDTLLLLHRRG
jgi:hypothetical protein